MKQFVLCSFITLITLNVFIRADHNFPHRKRSKRVDEATPPSAGLAAKDKESFQEALLILNMGKNSLHLPTEDTRLLLQLADSNNANDTDRSDEIQKFVEGSPDDQPPAINGKEYLELSGQEGKVHVDNFSLVTDETSSTKQQDEVEDVFKMVVQKKVPGSKDNAVHKISIVETNKKEPLSEMEFPVSRRRRTNVRSYYIPRARRKRYKDDPLTRLIRGDLFRNDLDDMIAVRGTGGVHGVDMRSLLGERNNRIRKRQSGRDGKGIVENEFRVKAFLPMPIYPRKERPLGRSRRTEMSYAMRDSNKRQKGLSPFNDFQSSNSEYWWNPSKSRSQINDDYVDNVLKTNNAGKSFDNTNYGTYEFPHHNRITTKGHTLRVTNHREKKQIKNNISSPQPKPSTSPQSNSTEIATTPKNVKIDVSSDSNRYVFEKSIIIPSEDNLKGTNSINITEVVIIMFIGLLCLAIVFLVFSLVVRWQNLKPCCNTLELKGAHVTVNIREDPDLSGQCRSLAFKSHSKQYYKKVTHESEGEFDLPDLDWHSEVGEWLSDQGSVRQAIAFEEL